MTKYLLSSFFCLTLFTACVSDDNANKHPDLEHLEVTIYDKQGKAVAYSNFLAQEEVVIYLWNGKPTTYYVSENENELYGFNGEFIGWREAGIYYDLEGKRIGFEKGALDLPTQEEPTKNVKEVLPVKSVKQATPAKHAKSVNWSEESLEAFLQKGVK